jgi:hypothetical protein
MNTSRMLRAGTVAFAAVLATAAGAAATGAASAETEYGSQDVTVDVEITDAEPGVLALTVAAGSAGLIEEGSTELVRQFVGALPTVTVTDTRSVDEVPDGAFWYVLGSATDFSSAGAEGASIGAENLGWSPQLLEGAGEPFISEGDDIDPAVDGGPGLVDRELLFLNDDSSGSVGGTWSATAGLGLKVPADVQAGSYTSTLTLSLFE